MDQVVSLGFVACAAVAVFLGVHKDDIQEQGIESVLNSYYASYID